MAAPFLVHNLSARRAAVVEARLVTSVGWIGDQAHQAECSDHNPDSVGGVHAIDCMTLVLANQRAIVQWALAHPDDLEYVINQRTIWSAPDFRPRAYTGTDPHTNHVHISGRHGAAHDVPHVTCTGYSLAAEAVTPEGFNVALTQADANLIVATLVKDKNFQALIWRVQGMSTGADTVQGGPEGVKGEPVKLTTNIAAIPVTAAPAAPADAQAVADAVLTGIELVQKPKA